MEGMGLLSSRRVKRAWRDDFRTELMVWFRKGQSRGTNIWRFELLLGGGGGALGVWLGVEPAASAAELEGGDEPEERSVPISAMMLLVEEERSSRYSRQSHRIPTSEEIWREG